MNFVEQVEKWVQEGDLGAIHAVLSGFREQGELARLYVKFFAKRREEGARLVAAGLGGLTDERVLARLPRILKERPDTVHFLLEAWLGDARGDLEALARGIWPFEGNSSPRFEWWRAAARFLEASGQFPRWEWFGRTGAPRVEEKEEQVRASSPGVATLGARLKRLAGELDQYKAALLACELREREAKDELEAREQRIRELEQNLASLGARCKEYERKLVGRDARIAKLEARIARLKGQLDECRAHAVRLEDISPEGPGDAGSGDKVADFENAHQIPFDPRELEGVWVIPYSELAREARERLRLLIGMYEAALRGKDHPALSRTNWDGLNGRPKGILLLDTDRLLNDMARLPLLRWLEASFFAREAYLFGLRRWVRKRTRALLESE